VEITVAEARIPETAELEEKQKENMF